MGVKGGEGGAGFFEFVIAKERKKEGEIEREEEKGGEGGG